MGGLVVGWVVRGWVGGQVSELTDMAKPKMIRWMVGEQVSESANERASEQVRKQEHEQATVWQR